MISTATSRMLPLRWLTAAATALLPPPPGVAQEEHGPLFPMHVEYDVDVMTRDGVRLSADVYRPLGPGRHPTLFSLTPYGNQDDGIMEQAWEAVARGYAWVTVDARGRYDSEGSFAPYRSDGPDGYDVIEWVATQPWSDGRVATHGGSYLGKVQWLIAREHHPAHAAIVSYVAGAHEFLDGARYSGVPKLDLRYTWIMGMDGRVGQARAGWDWRQLMEGLPLVELDRAGGRDIPAWRDLMRHDRLDDFWQASGLVPADYITFDVPSFNVTGWYEGQLRGQVQHYVNAVKTGDPADHVLVIGPWLHGVNRNRVVGERNAGPQAIIPLSELRDAWLDHRMLGAPDPRMSGFYYFVPGLNEWRTAGSFPVPGTRFTEYHLDSGGHANTLAGDGVLRPDRPGTGPPDAYTYDPTNPVPTLSSRTSGARGGLRQGSVDNRAVETRDDVLVYTSPPLTEGMEITGPVRAILHFSTDVVDTDLTVKLLDVHPDGRSLNLTEGIARAKYRDSYAQPTALEPGVVYRLQVELFPTSNWFAPGHSVRIEVASSDFPNFARNLNTMESDTGTEIRVARTRIHHTAEHPSHIVLPVVPAGAARPWTPRR